jgi:hypothetical protein
LRESIILMKTNDELFALGCVGKLILMKDKIKYPKTMYVTSMYRSFNEWYFTGRTRIDGDRVDGIKPNEVEAILPYCDAFFDKE